MQHKTVTVTTDDPAQPQTMLTLRAMIPTLLEVQPIFVFWKQDEDIKPKTIKVKAGTDSQVKKITVTSSDPEISALVKPGGAANEWDINVEPKDVKKLHNATLTILPESAGKPKPFMATARVIGPVPN